MATAKKVATKAVAKKVAPKKAPTAKKEELIPERQYGMPVEVKDWIEQASSRMRHMQGEIDRLKEENKALKSYRKFAEHRILRSEAE